VKCWGDNASGQLGQGDADNRGDNSNEMGGNLPTIELGTGRTATAISAGDDHTCALLDNGRVKCWGEAGNGRLGLEDAHDQGNEGGEMGDDLAQVDLGGPVHNPLLATAVTAGRNHTCALLENARIKCWGLNSSGQLGLDNTTNHGATSNTMGENLAFVVITLDAPTVIAVSAGADHTCARDNTGVKCWGLGITGQLGQGSTENRGAGPGIGSVPNISQMPPVDLGSAGAVGVSAGDGHSCALLTNASVKCWGDNVLGELGQGTTTKHGDSGAAGHEMGDALPAVDIGVFPADAVTTGDDHTCVRLSNGGVKCWGYNNLGQLGQGTFNTIGDGSNEMGNSLATTSLAVAPGAPGIPTGTPGNGQVSVAFAPPADNGHSLIDIYYVKLSPGHTSVTGAGSPVIFTGLTNGQPYTFTVQAGNSIGIGPESVESAPVTPASAPGAPTGASATPGNAQMTVKFTPPASPVGSPITGYTVTATPGGRTKSGAGSPLTVTGLTNGIAYTFRVRATNGIGTGPMSAASASKTSGFQPDVQGRKQTSAVFSDINAYTTAATATGNVGLGASVVYVVKLENDGNVTNTINLKGTLAGSSKMSVAFRQGASALANMTTAGRDYTLAPGKNVSITVTIKANAGTPNAATKTVSMTARSKIHTSKFDQVKVKATRV
jgi:alpha-tubulin suppressor-like RCC1 family protein